MLLTDLIQIVVSKEILFSKAIYFDDFLEIRSVHIYQDKVVFTNEAESDTQKALTVGAVVNYFKDRFTPLPLFCEGDSVADYIELKDAIVLLPTRVN